MVILEGVAVSFGADVLMLNILSVPAIHPIVQHCIIDLTNPLRQGLHLCKHQMLSAEQT
jgi:hypothetical protein